jgi:hypothetical protein
MSQPIAILLGIAKPILLGLVVDNGYVVVPDYVPAAEPLFVGSEAFKFQTGDKARYDEMDNIGNMVLLFENNLI